MRRPAAAATMPGMSPHLQLFQAEWCPSSHRVRQRLTELGVDYVARQVPVERCARTALVAAMGCDTIPALLLPNGAAVVGESNIVAYVGEHFEAGASARRHRAKAAELHRRRLEEDCSRLFARSVEHVAGT